MNFLPGTLQSDSDTARIELEDGSVLTAPRKPNHPRDGKVLLGLRPEHIMLGDGTERVMH